MNIETFEDNLNYFIKVYKNEMFTLKKAPRLKQINKEKLILLYSIYAKYKRIDEKLLNFIWNILEESSFRLYIGTMLLHAVGDYDAGEEISKSIDFVKKYFNFNEIINFDLDEYLDEEWVGLYNNLEQVLRRIYTSENSEELFLNIDKLMNVYHSNGKMADYLIQGGESTLDYIFNFQPKGIVLPGNVFEFKIYAKSFFL